ncbi:hypothetical protein CANARDRAFT_27170 [[Candida] arabinofermentans NRRL YB-2248]|uniref:Ribophorin II C-terminal domain-containing protein n=1 Tax=[Candida] arabinofermentans NRRL YB-2248 TaxID=983967 RepID=A0A1E4T4S8_9ASCO|nr:hypothetical protein CANARDRAFT_27170 [[Candida] arabinofermentans NRRL YB-2248]
MLSQLKTFVAFVLLSLLLLASQVNALKITKGSIQLDEATHQLHSAPIALETSNRNIEVSLILAEDNGALLESSPKQISVQLSAPNVGLETHFFPSKRGSSILFKFPVAEISKFLLTQDTIKLSLITGDLDSSKNSFIEIGQLKPTSELIAAASIESPVRFQSKPEIVHIFKDSPEYANPLICSIFVLVVLVLFSNLILGWILVDAINFKNLTKLPIGLTVQFLACVALFELIFFDYFLGTSIFTTIFRCAVIGVATVYIGSKVLRGMYELRHAGLR